MELIDGRTVPGILFDEATAKTHPEITEQGGWREYLGSRSDVSKQHADPARSIDDQV